MVASAVVVAVVVAIAAACAVAAYYYYYSCRRKRPSRRRMLPPPVVVKKRERHRANERRDAARRILGELDAAVSAFEANPEDWTPALEVASAYERGSYPVFRSDPETARALFHVIAASCPDAGVAAHARTRIVAHRMSVPDDDDAGAPMPRTCADRLVRLIATTAKRPSTPTLEVIHEDPRLVLALAETEPPVVYSDAQNVHDHGVVASLRSLGSLGSSQSSGGSNAAADDVEKAVAGVLEHDGVSPETKADALEFIERGVDDRVNESLGMSSKEALGAVWKRIEAIEDPELRSNAVETLALQMADGYNHGHVVCSTGRIARILGALDGVVPDADPLIKPTWAVKEEIASLAAKCSAEGLGGDEFERRATKTYVDDLGMSPGVVASIVGEFKDYVEQSSY